MCIEMAESAPNVVLLPQRTSISGKCFLSQGYSSQSKSDVVTEFWLMEWATVIHRQKQYMPLPGLSHRKSLHNSHFSSSSWSLEPSVEDGRASGSLGVWMTEWSTPPLPPSSFPTTPLMGFLRKWDINLFYGKSLRFRAYLVEQTALS